MNALNALLLIIFAGLNNIATLLNQRRYWLRIQLFAEPQNTAPFVIYDNFQVAPAAQLYKLTSVGACCGSGIGTQFL